MVAGSSSHALPAARASSSSNAPNNEKSNEKNNEKGQEMAGQRSRACRRCGSADHHYSTAKLCPKHPNFNPVTVGTKTKAKSAAAKFAGAMDYYNRNVGVIFTITETPPTANAEAPHQAFFDSQYSALAAGEVPMCW